MRLEITTHGIELTADLRDSVLRRIHFALGRFSTRIKSVSLRLADVNGPWGGLDKLCDVRIHAGRRRAVVIRQQHNEVYAAVAIAVERAERSMTRQLHLQRQPAAAAGEKMR